MDSSNMRGCERLFPKKIHTRSIEHGWLKSQAGLEAYLRYVVCRFIPTVPTTYLMSKRAWGRKGRWRPYQIPGMTNPGGALKIGPAGIFTRLYPSSKARRPTADLPTNTTCTSKHSVQTCARPRESLRAGFNQGGSEEID